MTVRPLVALMALALAAALTGCAQEDTLAESYGTGDGQNYVAGDGSVTEIAEENRGDPVTFSGTTETGETVTSDDYAGHPLVVNYWYASCAPCRVEAPDLEAAYEKYAPDGVGFLGVNVRDGADTAAAFRTTFGISYPSVIDVEDRTGGLLLAFSGYVSPTTVPTTLIVDAEGRVAARVAGRIDPSIFDALLDRVVAEQ